MPEARVLTESASQSWATEGGKISDQIKAQEDRRVTRVPGREVVGLTGFRLPTRGRDAASGLEQGADVVQVRLFVGQTPGPLGLPQGEPQTFHQFMFCLVGVTPAARQLLIEIADAVRPIRQ